MNELMAFAMLRALEEEQKGEDEQADTRLDVPIERERISAEEEEEEEGGRQRTHQNI